MKLEIHERLALLELLPKTGDYVALKTIRRAREMIGITPKEQDKLEFREIEVQGQARLNWNREVAEDMTVDVPIDEWTTEKIREILVELNNQEEIADKTFTLYEKFVT